MSDTRGTARLSTPYTVPLAAALTNQLQSYITSTKAANDPTGCGKRDADQHGDERTPVVTAVHAKGLGGGRCGRGDGCQLAVEA
ncbi:hypothetical protein NFJ02_22g50870 [Pycnococcus provasolii]